MTDPNCLRELALAATPGPWHTVDSPWLPRDCETYIIAGHHDPHIGKFVCDFEDADTLDDEDRNHWNNAAFIAAANPDVILELLDRLAAAERERDDLQHAYDSFVRQLTKGEKSDAT